jgi:hypothetical protein
MNNKKKIYYDEAERLYVIEQMNIEEIAARFNISVRAIKYWKKGQGWDVKRKEYLESKQTSHEDGYLYARKLLCSLKDDLKDERKISPSRLHSFANVADSFLKMKKSEDKQDELRKIYLPQEKRTTLTPEEVSRIRREFLGFKD